MTSRDGSPSRRIPDLGTRCLPSNSRPGLTYTSEGWEDCNSTPLINSAYILANDGGVYMRSVDTSGMTKSGDYTANLMLEDI